LDDKEAREKGQQIMLLLFRQFSFSLVFAVTNVFNAKTFKLKKNRCNFLFPLREL